MVGSTAKMDDANDAMCYAPGHPPAEGTKPMKFKDVFASWCEKLMAGFPHCLPYMRLLDSGVLAGTRWPGAAGQQSRGSPAVGPTRKTRILDSCRSGGFQASWLAAAGWSWLARKLAYLREQLWAY